MPIFGIEKKIHLFIQVLCCFQNFTGHITTGRAEKTSTYGWSRFCSVNSRPLISKKIK